MKFQNRKLFGFLLTLTLGTFLKAEINLELNFFQHNGSSLVEVENPSIGNRVQNKDSTPTAKFAFGPGTTFKFEIDSSSSEGELIFVIRETQPAAPKPDSIIPGEPIPTYNPPTIYWSHTIDLSTASGMQTVEIPELSTEIIGKDPNKIYYFGIYANGSYLTEVDAFFNDIQVGSRFGAFAEYHPELHLPILYLHPSWNPEPAIIEQAETLPFSDFVPNFQTYVGTNFFGGITGQNYRLVDTAPFDGIVKREWSIYKVTGSQLTLLNTYPGIGSGVLSGAFFDITPEDPPCNAGNCRCSGIERFVVTCKRFDYRGASSTTTLSLGSLGTESFPYTIGHDIEELAQPMDLLVGVQIGQSPVNNQVFKLSALELDNPAPLFVQPWGTGLGCWSWNPKYKIRYRLADSAVVVESEWKPSQYQLSNPPTVPVDFVGIPATQASNYPVRVWWQMGSDFGENAWTDDPFLINLTPQVSVPEFTTYWPDASTIFNPGDVFEFGIKTEMPVHPNASNYLLKYSLWVYDPTNPYTNNKRLSIRGGNTPTCLYVGAGVLQEQEWEIPAAANLGWELNDTSQLALRVKCIWYSTDAEEPICLISEFPNSVNALNTFEAIATGGIQYAVAGQDSSSVYETGAPSQGDILFGFDGEPQILDPTGGVAFQFPLSTSGTSPAKKLTWQWTRTNGDVWYNGSWVNASSNPGFSEIWPASNSSDVFAGRWEWDWLNQVVRAKYRSGGAPAPFASNGASNLFLNFFNGADSVTVRVTVTMEFQEGSPVTKSKTITLVPTHSDELVSGIMMIVDGEELSHLHSQVGGIPDLSWTVQTTSQQTGLLQAALFKANGSSASGWDQVACETVSSPSSLFSSVSISNGTNGKTYTLTATTGSGLFSQLNTLEAGKYQVRFSGEACSGGDWSGALGSSITLNSNEGFLVRLHYRDHLGSSTISQAYSPRSSSAIAGAIPFTITLNTGNTQTTVLYPQPEKTTHFTPFGKPMGDVNEEPNPRYTDHEFDAESGLNYMKGRYQLANFAKFNRPDPMRDWDWENPSSINLYQYVRNNPVMSWDPDGFNEDTHIQKKEPVSFVINIGSGSYRPIQISGETQVTIYVGQSNAGIFTTTVTTTVKETKFKAEVMSKSGEIIESYTGASVSSETEVNSIFTGILSLGTNLESSPSPTVLLSKDKSEEDLAEEANKIQGQAAAGRFVSDYSTAEHSVIEGQGLQGGKSLGFWKSGGLAASLWIGGKLVGKIAEGQAEDKETKFNNTEFVLRRPEPESQEVNDRRKIIETIKQYFN